VEAELVAAALADLLRYQRGGAEVPHLAKQLRGVQPHDPRDLEGAEEDVAALGAVPRRRNYELPALALGRAQQLDHGPLLELVVGHGLYGRPR